MVIMVVCSWLMLATDTRTFRSHKVHVTVYITVLKYVRKLSDLLVAKIET